MRWYRFIQSGWCLVAVGGLAWAIREGNPWPVVTWVAVLAITVGFAGLAWMGDRYR